MRLEQLQAFLETVQTQSISTAAHNLSLPQSSVSRMISKLENELQVSLFERSPLGVKLSSIGIQLLPFIEESYHSLTLLKKEAQKLSTVSQLQKQSFSVRVITLPLILDSFLVPAFESLKQALPQVKISFVLQNDQLPDQFPPLTAKDLYIGNNISHALESKLTNALFQQQYYYEPLFTEKMYAVMSENHPLSAYTSVSLETLFPYKLLLHDNNFAVSEFYQHYTKESKRAEIYAQSNNPQFIVNTLQNMETVFITTETLIKNDYIHQTALKIIPIQNTQASYFCLSASDSPFQFVFQHIISVLKSVHAGIDISEQIL